MSISIENIDNEQEQRNFDNSIYQHEFLADWQVEEVLEIMANPTYVSPEKVEELLNRY